MNWCIGDEREGKDVEAEGSYWLEAAQGLRHSPKCRVNQTPTLVQPCSDFCEAVV